MRRIRVLVLACALVLSTSAQADTVGIDFDLGDSTMSFIGTINIPPDGTIHSMGATTILPAIKTGGGATAVQTGSAQLKNLTLDMTIDAGSFLVAHITGHVFVSQVGTSTGPFTNTQSVMFGGTGTGTGTSAGMSLFISALLDCQGLFCSSVGNFPIDITGTNPAPAGQAFTIFLASLNTPGAANVDGTMPISIPPATPPGTPTTGTVFLMGNEVSRTYEVPEPGSLAQLIPGAIVLAGLSRRRRQNRGASQ
ncbi:MAG: hypothetical protein JRE38_07360 [Deltaproteobacteria bacterium]|nr:hypothetical protein [Deltaproteobacteria bacterium]